MKALACTIWLAALPATAAVVLSAVAAPAAAASSQPLGLAEALDYADKSYPAVKAALEDRTAADRGVDVARTAYLPQVNLLWQINRATANNITGLLLPQGVIPSLSGPVVPRSDQADWNSGAGVLLSWRLFDFGVRSARVDEAQQTAAGAGEAYELTRLDVMVATANAYLNVEAAEATAKAAQANVDRLRSFRAAVEVLVDNKLRAGVELQQAKAAEALGQAQLIGARAEADRQRATLAKLIGRPPEDLALADPRLATPPDNPAAGSPAPGDHPAVRAEAAKVREQEAKLHAIEGAYAPQLDLLASASARGSGKAPNGTFLSGDPGLRPDVGNWAAGLQVTLPLGSYPTVHAQQGAQRAALNAERDRYEGALRDVQERQRQARTSLESARAIAQTTPFALEAARQAEAQQRSRFQSGLATAVDVTAAEAVLAQAESQDANATLNVWRALAAWSAATGDLAPFRAAVARR